MSELSLSHDSVAMRPYSDELRAAVQQAAKQWTAFLELPDSDKTKLTATNYFNGSGYEIKQGDGAHGSHDHKENFDLQLGSTQQLLSRASSGAAQELIMQADELLQLLRHEGRAFVEEISKEHPLDRVATAEIKPFLRFLSYPPMPDGATIGEAHTDHSGFTFHLYESTDGCECLHPLTRDWRPMPVTDEAMVAFGSMQLQLASKGEIKALSHRIIANSTTAQQGRIAIVCFYAFGNNYPHYDRKNHGRLQEKEPGFNYDLSPKEFEQFFTTD